MVGPNDQPMMTKFTDAYSTNVVTYCSVQEHEEAFAMESRGYTFTSKPMDGGQRVDAEHIDRYAEFEKKKNKVTIGFKQLYKEPSKQSVELKDWRDKFTGDVFADSSAALAITKRKGSGKLRHINVGLLWVQQQAASKDLVFQKVAGESNPADLMTKYLTVGTSGAFCEMIKQVFPGGRADAGLKVQSGQTHSEGLVA